MTSSTVENYLKQLYLEQNGPEAGEPVTTGRLAAAMAVTPGTATSMMKTLAQAGLVAHEARRGVRLTQAGEQLALHVLRRHRLLELFLVEVLKLDWAEVHDEADRLEHAVSDRVLERIDALLGHPTTDPHGDPIPQGDSHVEAHDGQSLAECSAGTRSHVRRIALQDPAFLRFVEREGLVPGAAVEVLSVDPVAGAVRVRVAEGTVSLGLHAAANILLAAAEGTG